jgi:aerobic-type carbon monoxide dehydrogenase small subunit (CoxS/CutS family)
LVAAGLLAFRQTAKRREPRGMYCGIGLCHECAMMINGVPNTRACQTPATPGCRVETQDGLGRWEGGR